MHANPLLDDLTARVLQEIGKFGLCSASIGHYRKTYNRLKEFASTRGVGSFSNCLIDSFIQEIGEEYQAGQFGNGRRNHLKRAALLLRDYAANGSIEWKVASWRVQLMPVSQRFLLLHEKFIFNLQSRGKSANTIQSCKNAVRLFLLFLEDNGCSALSMATSEMVPAFFQHLLATYKPTSIRTVASWIRSFLQFSEEDRLLRAVPARCVRDRPIIPILSDAEHNALLCVLQDSEVRLRDKAIILLALRTGLRAVDIVGMRLEDIDWVTDSIAITQAKTGTPLKIPLTVDVGNSLSAYILNERPKTDGPFVFLRSRAPFKELCGRSACYGLVRQVFHHAGIRLGSERKGIHVLRHSAASKMLSNGVPITTISSMLGHANKSSTDVYLSTNKEGMKACALDLAEIPMNCGGLA